MARNASWLLAGQGANLVLRALSFLFLARLLGVTEYGIFAGAFALVSTIAPYSDLGFGMLFMRYVSKDGASAKSCWGNSLLITGVTTVIITVLAVLSGPFLTGAQSRMIFVALTLGNCLFLQITIIASKAFQIYEKMRMTALLRLTVNLGRLVAVLVLLVTVHRATAVQWAWASMWASAIAAVLALVWVGREVGGMSFQPRLIVRRMWEGMQFSLAGSATTVYNDVDKAMLGHYGFIQENGFYSLAYRIIDVATAPIAALEMASLPRFFHLSRIGFRDVARLLRKSVRTGVLMAAATAAFIVLSGPLIPHLVGKDFSGVISALRWLCWIPIFRSIHLLTGSALTGSGHQGIRTSIQFGIAALNIILNFLWIPRHGWVGAAASSVISDGLLAVLYTAVFMGLSRKALQVRPSEAEPAVADPREHELVSVQAENGGGQ